MTEAPPDRVLKILLVDDQPLLRTGFRMIIDHEPDMAVVGEADDGHQAFVLTGVHRPDIVLMDVQMPRVDGIQATRDIIAAHPNVKIVLLTTFDVDEYVVEGLRAGANGFLLKDVRPDDLLTALRTVHDGQAFLSPASTRRLIKAAVPRLPTASTTSSTTLFDELTEREHDVLLALARGASNREIAAEMFISEGTVKVHVGRVLAKLQVRDRVQAVVLAYENGLVHPAEGNGA